MKQPSDPSGTNRPALQPEPAPTPARPDNWRCDTCGREADPLYYHGSLQLCEDCHRRARSAA